MIQKSVHGMTMARQNCRNRRIVPPVAASKAAAAFPGVATIESRSLVSSDNDHRTHIYTICVHHKRPCSLTFHIAFVAFVKKMLPA